LVSYAIAAVAAILAIAAAWAGWYITTACLATIALTSAAPTFEPREWKRRTANVVLASAAFIALLVLFVYPWWLILLAVLIVGGLTVAEWRVGPRRYRDEDEATSVDANV
jgi:hypothetical protein